MTMTIAPLATADQFLAFGSARELTQNTDIWTPDSIDTLMVDATTMLQSRCQARLTTFTGKVEWHEAYGINPDEYGQQGDLPMDLSGALGWSQATSLGIVSMVREFWLDDTAPMYAENWSYVLEEVEILRTFGDDQLFNSPAEFVSWQGPSVDTGHVKMPIGTYCPVGSIIKVTYGGGYNPIPGDLKMACIFQGMKLIMLGNEPGARKGSLSMDELDAEIVVLLGPYSKS